MKKIQTKTISKKTESEENERLRKLDTFENEILPVFLMVVSKETGFTPSEILEFFSHQTIFYWFWFERGYTPIERAFEYYFMDETILIKNINYYFRRINEDGLIYSW